MSDNHINGNGRPSKDATVTASGSPLTNFRLEPGQSVYARILSIDYKGIFTHYHHKRSQYCPGKECSCPLQKVDRTWKGYCAVEIGKAGSNIWKPFCLEITEALELDFRYVFARGQVWQVFRDPKTDHKQPPYQGKLHKSIDPAKLRAAFNILPVVNGLYHRHDIELLYPSPIADRVYLTPSVDEAPIELPTADQERAERDEAVRRKIIADQEAYARSKKANSRL